MTFATITYEVQDDIGLITLNRPDRLNAWTYQMGAELRQALQNANADEAVTALVVTGAGRGFCAGADIEAVFKAQAEEADAGSQGDAVGMGDWVSLVRESKPLIAAINGAAVGVGLTQVLPMDYLIAAETAKISLRFVKMGLVPELASSQLVVSRVGLGRASRLMLTGETLNGAEAARVQLVDECVADQDLLSQAFAVARAMGCNPQGALRQIKALITANMVETDLQLVQQREGVALAECYASAEHHEAIEAFMNRREPDFKAARQRQG